jgi:hypothetical protein
MRKSHLFVLHRRSRLGYIRVSRPLPKLDTIEQMEGPLLPEFHSKILF